MLPASIPDLFARELMEPLPIDRVLGELLPALDANPRVILRAAPGAGKTTRVPIACLDSRWLGKRRIVMLEPRRLAARGAAAYMAALLGETTGATVGYRMRGESSVSEKTRILVVTEGVLTRMLQDDPALSDVGLVIFDEFHERSVHADLGLAFALETQDALRPDLRILVMSATLEAEGLHRLLPSAVSVVCEGQSYPITDYAFPPDRGEALESVMRRAAIRALSQDRGDLLAFLPGRFEIAKTQRALEPLAGPELTVLTLSADTPLEQQSRILRRDSEGRRKIVLATSIAESSITIDGVTIVLDSGQMRIPRYDPGRGMGGLVTLPASRAALTQRRGRAGRQAPGSYYRLWPASEDSGRAEHTPAEILRTDLAPVVLESAIWGIHHEDRLRTIDAPPREAWNEARSLLTALEALDANGSVTAHGRAMAEVGVHPRLAHMILRGKGLGFGAAACELAALLEERDIGNRSEDDVEIARRWHRLQEKRPAPLVRRVIEQAQRLKQRLGIHRHESSAGQLGVLAALAYPDRIAKRRANEGCSYLLATGGGAELPFQSILRRHEYIVAPALDARERNARIMLAEPIGESEIREHFASQLRHRRKVSWNERSARVDCVEEACLGALVLRAREILPDAEELALGLLEGLRGRGWEALPHTEASERLRARSEWLRDAGFIEDASWPVLTREALWTDLERWLVPYLAGKRTLNEVAQLDLHGIFGGFFSRAQYARLEEMAPAAIELPSGSTGRIRYEPGQSPVLSVYLQEMFGQAETPRIAGGKQPVTVELLSPAKRPLQVTRDLAGFWRSGYVEVRKEVRARYPRHEWPEDPLNAAPSRGIKRRR